MSFEDRDEDETVTDPAQDPQEHPTDGKEAIRPIPDGGLQQSMPEWLRRPPAWRNLPKREEPPSPETPASEAAPAPVAKELPEPDTSEIDPRSLVDIADLPQWLQEIAARSDAAPVAPKPVTTRTEPAAELLKEPQMSKHEERNPVDVGVERAIPFEPVRKGAMDVPEHETRTYGGGAPKQGPNPILMGIIALAILVVLVLILMAIM